MACSAFTLTTTTKAPLSGPAPSIRPRRRPRSGRCSVPPRLSASQPTPPQRPTRPTDLLADLVAWISDSSTPLRTVCIAGAVSLTLALALSPNSTPDAHSLLLHLPTPSPNPTLPDLLISIATSPRTLVASALAASAFTQALSGFGFAIVSVGLLAQVPWIANSSLFDTVQPIAAILGSLVGAALLLPDLPRLSPKQILPLLVPCILATPLGALLGHLVDTGVTLRILGGTIVAFVVYSVTKTDTPRVLGTSPAAVVCGLLAGLLGGAFDIQGPPLVVYGDAKGWGVEEFRRNVLSVVTVNSMVVVGVDWWTGRLEDFYVGEFVRVAAPAVVLAVVLGKVLASRLDPAAFKKAVLGICAVMGVKLLM